MSAPDEIQKVGVRAKWKDEALDFTPWLARNLGCLAEALDMPLELVQTEVPVGPYFLDILAKNPDTGVFVAIENQLEETDHTHLGQLFTYAAGCDAGIAIWVAPEFGYEHAQALDKLNKWTGEGIRFYGIKVEAIKNPTHSDLDARFHKVVYPGGWNKELTRQAWEMPMVTRQYYDFFQPLITELLGIGFADKVSQGYGRTSRIFPSTNNEGFWYSASIERWNNRDDAWVVVHICTEDRDLTNRIFDELHSNREEIEPNIDPGPRAQWEWLRFNSANSSQIGFSVPASIDDPPEQLEAIRAWMLDMLPRLKEVFEPRLEKLLQ